jgi:hypothetical protein
MHRTLKYNYYLAVYDKQLERFRLRPALLTLPCPL